jgi:hypothetical protein
MDAGIGSGEPNLSQSAFPWAEGLITLDQSSIEHWSPPQELWEGIGLFLEMNTETWSKP